MPPRKEQPKPGPEPAAVYIRVSRVGERGAEGQPDLLSPELQMEAGRAFARLHDLALDEALSLEHADLDQSGFRKTWKKRPGIQALLAAAQQGRIRHLIVYKLSRLARNAREGLEIFDAFERAGCSIHVVKEGIDSATPVGRMVRTILLAVAEMQSEDTRQFVRDASLARVKAGHIHGNQPPEWLRRQKDGSFTPVPAAVASYRRVAELRTSGLSLAKTVRTANSEGHRTARGSLWNPGALQEALSEWNIKRMEGTAMYNPDLPEGDPYRVETPGAWPAILTPEEALALRVAQRSLTSSPPGDVPHLEQTRGKGPNRRLASSSYILSYVLACPVCGSPMFSAASGSGPSQRFYRCKRAALLRPADQPARPHASHALIDAAALGNAREGPQEGAGGASDAPAHGVHPPLWISADMVEESVLFALRWRFITLPPAPKDKDRMDKSNSAAAKAASDPARPRRTRAQILAAMDRIADAFADGTLPKREYGRQLERLMHEEEALGAWERRQEEETMMTGALSAIAGSDIAEPAQLAQAVRTLVERIEAPVTIPNVGPSHLARHPARFARITLRAGQVLMSPLHTGRFKGEWILRNETGEEIR